MSSPICPLALDLVPVSTISTGRPEVIPARWCHNCRKRTRRTPHPSEGFFLVGYEGRKGICTMLKLRLGDPQPVFSPIVEDDPGCPLRFRPLCTFEVVRGHVSTFYNGLHNGGGQHEQLADPDTPPALRKCDTFCVASGCRRQAILVIVLCKRR